ncbi:MAG: hypothetical protein WKF37_22360 [Bryobacteraceae bacterium]
MPGPKKLLVWVSSALSLLGTFLFPHFRDDSGALSGAACFPLAVTFGLAALAITLGSIWKRVAWWFALALVGQAAALQTIDAGRLIHYQHYRPSEHAGMLIVLVAYVSVVLRGVVRHRTELARLVSSPAVRWKLGALLVALCLPAAAVGRDYTAYAGELLFAALIQLTAVANLTLAALTLPPGGKAVLEKATETILKNCVVPAAVWSFAVPALLAFFTYQRHPHIPDEVGYLYHARYLAAGMLTMPAPPVPSAFNLDLMTFEAQRWFCPMPPGWPAVLSLGVLAGLPWLVNPLLTGLNILLAGRVFRELYDERTAAIGVLLLAGSPWVIFLGMSFMNHTVSFTLLLLGILGICLSRSTASVGWAALSGAVTGALSLVRPLDAVCLAAMLGIAMIGLVGKRIRVGAIAVFTAICGITAAMILPYNYVLTGSYRKSPLIEYFNKYYWEGVSDLGFGANRGVGWAIDPFPATLPLMGW